MLRGNRKKIPNKEIPERIRNENTEEVLEVCPRGIPNKKKQKLSLKIIREESTKESMEYVGDDTQEKSFEDTREESMK